MTSNISSCLVRSIPFSIMMLEKKILTAVLLFTLETSGTFMLEIGRCLKLGTKEICRAPVLFTPAPLYPVVGEESIQDRKIRSLLLQVLLLILLHCPSVGWRMWPSSSPSSRLILPPSTRTGHWTALENWGKIWLNCYCWGNSSILEGRFSKWF